MADLFGGESPLVVGVDTSLTATGAAWPDGHCITHGRKGLTLNDRPLRQQGLDLKSLVVALHNLIIEHAGVPTLAVFEELPKDRVDAQRGYVWYSLVNALESSGCTCMAVQPSQLKKYATGTGAAGKPAVIEATVRRLPQFQTGGDDNRCDAAWLCAIGTDLLGEPLVSVPTTHRAALAKLALPEVLRTRAA